MTFETPTISRGLSAAERRARNHAEMRAGIVACARDLMREKGVADISLNEIARRLGVATPALYTYFPSKHALYDELYREGIRILKQVEEELGNTTEPDWERIEAFFTRRIEIADEHPDLYHLVFDLPQGGFLPSEESLEEVRKFYEVTVRNIAEVIDAGRIRPNVSAEQATDLLIAMRLGIVASHVGKYRVPSAINRIERLVPEAVSVLRAAWNPD